MTTKEFQERSDLRIFLSYFKPHKKLFVLDMVCALTIALIDLAFPYLSRWCMYELLPQNAYRTFFTVMAVAAAAFAVRGVLTYIIGYYGHTFGILVEADIRRDLFRHMQELDFGYYDRNRTGALMSRLTSELFEITELAHHGPEDIFISGVTVIGALVIMFTIQWRLALVIAAILPVFLIVVWTCRRSMSQASRHVKQKTAAINAGIESGISGIRTAKAFANEAAESAKFDQANDQFRGAKRGYYRAMAFYQSGMEFFMGILSVVVIAFGGFLLMRGRMDLIDLTTFFLYISTFITPIRKLSAFVEQFMQGMAGFKRFVALMRVEPDIQDEPDAQELTDVKGDIRVEDVTFRYEPSDPPVLEHVTLHVRPGETVAVVGPSGGGKSTLCQLIPRFYDVTGGRVLVDGKDVRTLTQHSLRANIGIVQQDVFLFAGTIYDNIRYGRPDATEAEIVEAAKRAEIYDDILDMPDGFQTQVGERGAMLSGGQKQRVSIARIFLKNPPVLILDEATSALDSVTEARIQSAFDELAKGRTTLIIAHRLSTIRSASRILVIDGNGIQEEGTHEELMAKDGEYVQLYLAQKSVSV